MWTVYGGLAGLILLAFCLRLVRLEAQSIWWDEAISLHLAGSSLAQLLADRAVHVHPPLYFLLLKGWVHIAGASAFAARFFSVWFNVLLVPVAYVLGSRWLDRTAGYAAAFLVVLSPLYVVYSQEARVYALLPLFYGLLLIIAHRLRNKKAPRPWRDWALLSLLEVIGLHLHYVSLFAVAYVRLLLVVDLRRRRARPLRWLTSLVVVAAASLPWVAAVLLRWQSVLGDVGSGDPFVEPVPLDHLARLVWTFQWSGLIGAPGYEPVRLAAYLLAGLLLLALMRFLSSSAQDARPALELLGHWWLPLAASLLIWVAKPLAHPRYVTIFTVGLFIFCAYAIVRLGRGTLLDRVLALLVTLAILSCAGFSLHAYAFDQEFAKDDVRALAAWLEDATTEDDLIIAPFRDWSLDYAYYGPAPIVRPNLADEDRVWKVLDEQCEAGERVFLVTYPDATQDHRDLLPFALETSGGLVAHHSFEDLRVQVYHLNESPLRPKLRPAEAQFGPLHLTGAWVEEDVPSNNAVGVRLSWRLERSLKHRLRVHLYLKDSEGQARASSDDWLFNAAGLPTDRWRADEEAATYHLLPLPPGTPPVTYSLAINVYRIDRERVGTVDLLDEAGNPRGTTFNLERLTLSPPTGAEENAYGLRPPVLAWDEPVRLPGGLALEGAAIDRESLAPGQSLSVSLRWRSEKKIVGSSTASLVMRQGEQILTETVRIGGSYPASDWSVGEMVVSRHRLVVPAPAKDGWAQLVLLAGGREVALGQMEIMESDRVFETPSMGHELHVQFGNVVELLGYDLASGPYYAGEPIALTLYWRALDAAATSDYVVFTHLLDADGRLVAQHDGRPVDGRRPSRGWVPGEILVDNHSMTFRRDYVGPATIEVGLYRSDDLQRVSTERGNDAVHLPTTLQVGGR